MELALFGSHFGDVDVKVADGIGPESLLGWLVALNLRQPADAVTLIAPMKRRASEMRDGGLQGVKAIVERQQRMLSESHRDGFLLDGQYRRARVLWSHGRIMHEGALFPLGDGLGIEAVACG